MRSFIFTICLALCASPALAQDYRLQAAAASELQQMCGADSGQLWTTSLCGPLIVVDGRTREVWATQRDNTGVLTLTPDGGWVGTLPAGVPVANTTVDWGGVRWIMVVGPLPEDATARRVLVAHEAWHRVQTSIGLPMQNVNAAHLETERGRYLMRLELRALATAMLSNGRARRNATRDALAFRMARLSSFAEARTAEAFRGLIDAALDLGGSYFLTYHRHATREQVLRAYPQFEAFLERKRHYDPRIRFTSDWYRHQTALLGHTQ